MSYLHRQVLANFFREIEHPALAALEAAAAAAAGPALAPLTTAAIEAGGQVLHSALQDVTGTIDPAKLSEPPQESPEAVQAAPNPSGTPAAAQAAPDAVLGKVAALAGAVQSIAAELAALQASLLQK